MDLTPSTSQTGNRQETHPAHSQAPAGHRRGLARRHQRTPHTTTRSPDRGAPGGHQGGQGEEVGGGEQEEG